MGLFKSFTCHSKSWFFPALYLCVALGLVVLGVLYETNVLDSPFDSEYWYVSVSLLLLALFFSTMGNGVINKNVSEEWKSVTWAFSHFLNYFLLTFFSPKEWPFWLSAGVFWEGLECWSWCMDSSAACSGFFDIMVNLAGVASALSIRQGVFNGGRPWMILT